MFTSKDEINRLKKENEELKKENYILREENIKLQNEAKELRNITKTYCYLKPKERQISNEEILYIKTLREKEGLSYKSIQEETGWSRATICRVLNGKYD